MWYKHYILNHLPNIISEITEENNEIIWTSSLTKALISERIECDSLFQRPSCKKIKLWRSIAIKLNSAFKNKINLTDKICNRKWRNLWQTYKANVKKSNNTGSDSIIWEYFNDFNEHFGTKDNINPNPLIWKVHLHWHLLQNTILHLPKTFYLVHHQSLVSLP